MTRPYDTIACDRCNREAPERIPGLQCNAVLDSTFEFGKAFDERCTGTLQPATVRGRFVHFAPRAQETTP